MGKGDGTEDALDELARLALFVLACAMLGHLLREGTRNVAQATRVWLPSPRAHVPMHAPRHAGFCAAFAARLWRAVKGAWRLARGLASRAMSRVEVGMRPSLEGAIIRLCAPARLHRARALSRTAGRRHVGHDTGGEFQDGGETHG